MKRSASSRSRASSESQLGTQAGRGDSTVPSGTTPEATWRANVLSRHWSQPWAKWPLYFAIQSAGAWWGEWQAPVAKYRKKGMRVVDRPEVAQELDGPVGQICAQVIALLDRSGRPHAVVVVVETRDELVGLAPVESIPAVEASAERPRRPRGGHVGLLLGAEVPLPHGVGGVAVGPEDLGDEAVLPWRAAPVAGKTRGQIRHPSHAAAVMIASRQQARPGGGAQRSGVEVGEADPVVRQAVDDGGFDVGAVTAQLGEADVVEHDQHDVGRVLGWSRTGRPPGLRVAPVVADLALELDPGHCHHPHTLDGAQSMARDDRGSTGRRIGPAAPARRVLSAVRGFRTWSGRRGLS